MTENTVNIPLLRKAVEWAEAEAAKPPELCEWEQTAYVIPSNIVQGLGRSAECGTCYCIAGWVAHQVEGAPFPDLESPNIAQEALGLTPCQRIDLFRSLNTIEDVRRIAEEIAGERL